MRAFLVLIALLLAPAGARAGDYLDDPKVLAEGWFALTAVMGRGTDLATVVIEPGVIRVRARAARGGPRVDGWEVRLPRGLFGGHAVSGPSPERGAGPDGDVESGFFPAAALRLDLIPKAGAEALRRAAFSDPSRVTQVRIERMLVFAPDPSYGELRWSIQVASAYESATASVTPEGVIIGMDLSQTMRGRNRDFLAQPDWPFSDAQRGFAALVAGAEVWEVRVRRATISVNATSPEREDRIATYSWDGGRFTRGLADRPLIAGMGIQSDLPFAIGEVDLALLPRLVAAAKAAAPQGFGHVHEVLATRAPAVPGPPAVEWTVTLKRSPADPEEAEIHLATTGEVLRTTLPESLRARASYLDPAGLVAALAEIRAALGGGAPVYEVMIREDRISVLSQDPADPSRKAEVELRGGVLKPGFGSFVMMETEEDLFALDVLASLDPARLAEMKRDAVARIGLADAEVYRMKIWNGSPFWRSRDGQPLVDIRVGLPPSHNTGGYVVYRIDGMFVEAVK